MIDTIAQRRVTLNGKTHQKGDTVQMPAQQFADLEATGMFKRADKPAATATKSSEKAD